MSPTISRTAIAFTAATLLIVAPLSSPAFAAPRETSRIDVGGGPPSVAFSPNGKKAYVANYFDGTVSVIKTR